MLPKGPLPITVSKDGLAFFNRDAFLAGFAPDVAMPMRVFMADSQVPLAVGVYGEAGSGGVEHQAELVHGLGQ